MAYTINDGHAKPYVYQEYPRRMYKAGEIPCSVGSDEARAAKEAEGWSVDHAVVSQQPDMGAQAGAPLVAGAEKTGETLAVECTTEADVDLPRRKSKKGRA